MAVIMHFATFLKFLTLNTGDKIRGLEKYAQPGGFDFYRSSREGVFRYCAHGMSKDRVVSGIRANSASNAEAVNVEVFEKVSSWLEKQKAEYGVPGRGVWRSPTKVFSVHIEPEILFAGKMNKVMAVYPRQEPRLNRDQAGAGVLLLERAYRPQGDHKFGILDAYGSRAYWTPTNVSNTLLDREIEFIEAELTRILP